MIVAPKVGITASRATAPLGRSFTFSTTVSPRHGGQRVVLQRFYDGAWRRVGLATLSASSTASVTVTPRARGEKRYRIHKPADGDHAAGTSRILAVRVL